MWARLRLEAAKWWARREEALFLEGGLARFLSEVAIQRAEESLPAEVTSLAVVLGQVHSAEAKWWAPQVEVSIPEEGLVRFLLEVAIVPAKASLLAEETTLAVELGHAHSVEATCLERQEEELSQGGVWASYHFAEANSTAPAGESRRAEASGAGEAKWLARQVEVSFQEAG